MNYEDVGSLMLNFDLFPWVQVTVNNQGVEMVAAYDIRNDYEAVKTSEKKTHQLQFIHRASGQPALTFFINDAKNHVYVDVDGQIVVQHPEHIGSYMKLMFVTEEQIAEQQARETERSS